MLIREYWTVDTVTEWRYFVTFELNVSELIREQLAVLRRGRGGVNKNIFFHGKISYKTATIHRIFFGL